MSERTTDEEYRSFSSLPSEYPPLPAEDAPLPPEFDAPSGGIIMEEEQTETKTGADAELHADPQKRHARLRRLFLAPVAASLAAVSIMFAAVGYDPIGWDLFAGSSSSSVETADASFPSLSNLKPNGSVPGWGVLDEEFVRIESGSSAAYIVAGKSYTSVGIGLSTVPGVTYDSSTNTIILNNYTGPVLNINLMGNGLKLQVNGTNTLDHLLVWGFGYGGSLTVTGTGSLTVNAAGLAPYGILFRGENSQTCLMVDKGVTLDAYGASGAIYVEDTTMAKAIYYLSPTVMSGGFRGGLPSTVSGCNCFSVIDETTGLPSTHVTFTP